MPLWKQAMLRRLYQEEAGSGEEGGAGGGAAGEQKPEDKAGAAGEQKPVDGGARKPTDEEAKLLKENMKRKEALDKAQADLAAARSVVSQLEELGGLDALKALVTEKKTKETEQLEAKGEWDRLRTRMADEHTKALKTAQDQAAEVTAKLAQAQAQIEELTVGSNFSNSNFIREDLLLTPSKTRALYGAHFERVDGKVVGYDKPRGAAERTPLVDASGNPVSFDEALRKIVDADPDKDTLLRSKMKPGAGSDSKRNIPAKGVSTENMSGVDRIAAALAAASKAK